MNRTIDINNRNLLNIWVRQSIELFETTAYLDNITNIYPFHTIRPTRLEQNLRRRIIMAHQARNSKELIEIFRDELTRFAYDEPLWYLYKNVNLIEENNPNQLQRITTQLYTMTADETVAKMEVPPKLNTQIGPMFTAWTRNTFNLLPIDDFSNSTNGIFVLDASEEDARNFINAELHQNLDKRPDLVAKVNEIYIIGEAKWIGQPGGNQWKQVKEVLDFCRSQIGEVRRIGIIDGFPWAVIMINGNTINDKTAVAVQESEYDITSALLLPDYLNSLI